MERVLVVETEVELLTADREVPIRAVEQLPGEERDETLERFASRRERLGERRPGLRRGARRELPDAVGEERAAALRDLQRRLGEAGRRTGERRLRVGEEARRVGQPPGESRRRLRPGFSAINWRS